LLVSPEPDCSSACTLEEERSLLLTLLVAVLPRVEIVELAALSTLVTGTPPLLAAPGVLLPLG